MINFEISQRLVRMHERLRACTYSAIRRDGHHKSSEGCISLSFNLPAVVSDEKDPYWVVEVYSYLFCPGAREESFRGKTALEAIAKAEGALDRWLMAEEMSIWSRDMGMDDDDAPAPGLDEGGHPF